MAVESMLVDSNLLVLLVVGETDRGLIARHRRLKMFRDGDYDRLVALLAEAEAICVTPNTLTETSNLLAYGAQSQQFALRNTLKRMIEDRFVELVVPSEQAVQRWQFPTLGLTDAALLDLLSPRRRLLTTDVDLYRMAASLEPDGAISFTEWVEGE